MVELLLLVLLLGCGGVWAVLALGLVHLRCRFLRSMCHAASCCQPPRLPVFLACVACIAAQLQVWPGGQATASMRTFVQACAANIMHYALFVNPL